MRTYSSLVDPTDLCLKLCQAHEQNYVIFPDVARSSRCRLLRHIRSAGDVGLDTAQLFEFIFWALSAFREVPGEAKHSTWFYVLPLRSGQSPRVF